MASVTGCRAWGLMSGRYVPKFEAALGRPVTGEELEAFSEDAHGGWWETSMMLLLRPDLVGGGWRDLPAARYSMAHRLIPNYPVRNGGQGKIERESVGEGKRGELGGGRGGVRFRPGGAPTWSAAAGAISRPPAIPWRTGSSPTTR